MTNFHGSCWYCYKLTIARKGMTKQQMHTESCWTWKGIEYHLLKGRIVHAISYLNVNEKYSFCHINFSSAEYCHAKWLYNALAPALHLLVGSWYDSLKFKVIYFTNVSNKKKHKFTTVVTSCALTILILTNAGHIHWSPSTAPLWYDVSQCPCAFCNCGYDRILSKLKFLAN